MGSHLTHYQIGNGVKRNNLQQLDGMCALDKHWTVDPGFNF